ncbi:hypothetical protein BDY19DRAFT_1092838, partial [Irpex rosettiformis]
MRQLVYEVLDSHLWRELFLTIFDDPRLAMKADQARSDPLDTTQDQIGGNARGDGEEAPDEATEVFDWGEEFRARVWAINYLRSQSNTKNRLPSAPRRRELNSDAISTIVRMIETAEPSPPTVIVSFAPDKASTNDEASFAWHPPFPPPPKTSSTPTSTPTSDLFKPNTDCSSNIRWLEQLVAGGLPPDLVKKLSGKRLYGGLQGVWNSPTLAREIRAFCKLICCTGFVPIPQPEEPEAADLETAPAPTSNDDDDSLLFSFSPLPTFASDIPKGLSMSVAAQRIRARRLARMRVYNLRYLNQVRHWGPYLLPPKLDNTASEVDVSRMFLAPILNFLADHLQTNWLTGDDDDDNDDDEDDSSDDEYVDADNGEEHTDDDSQEDESEHEEQNDEDNIPYQLEAEYPTEEPEHEEEHEDGFEEDQDEHDEIPTQHPPPVEEGSPTPIPGPSEMRADWTFLAAARIVVEENPRESVEPSDLVGLCALNGLRRDSAPRVLNSPEVQRPVGTSSRVIEGGWDWAGVTGSWRRCVCRMDNSTLISDFPDALIHEAHRIVRTLIRVVSYSPCSIPKYRHRPDIHVVADVTSQHGGGPMRKMKGTVGMIADGSIRWSM